VVEEKDLEVKEALPDYNRLYTIEDYYKLIENIRAELYEGALVVLEGPTTRHQEIQMEVSGPLWQYLKGKKCKVFTPSFSVQLFENENTVFIPDVTVVCDMTKLGKRSYNGAPDFILEILSPSTARMDKKYKFNKYQKAGVREYWIIDPERNLLEANILENGKYIMSIYDESDIVPVTILDGFEIDLAEVFAE